MHSNMSCEAVLWPQTLLNVFVVFSLMTSPSGKLASFVSLSNVKELNIRIELALVLVDYFFKWRTDLG